MVEVNDVERRAILAVADVLIGRAGRTTLVLALRGSRSKRVLQFGADRATGYGYFAGVPADDVMAKVDALIDQRILALERNDGLPLLVYTPKGLALAERNAADNWLSIVRAQIDAMRQGAAFDFPFVHAKEPNRNLRTLELLMGDMQREADATWLDFLEAWKAVETKRVRGWLQRVIDGCREKTSK